MPSTGGLPWLAPGAASDLNRLLLGHLHAQERLAERFMQNLLFRVHPGFSVFAAQVLSPEDPQQLERVARTCGLFAASTTKPPHRAQAVVRCKYSQPQSGLPDLVADRHPCGLSRTRNVGEDVLRFQHGKRTRRKRTANHSSGLASGV